MFKPFSQRKGIKPARSVLQRDSIDPELRNRLWDCFTSVYVRGFRGFYVSEDPIIRGFLLSLWHNYFKRPTDTIPEEWNVTYGILREYFFDCAWNEVYDFVEFTARNHTSSWQNQNFIEACNAVLQQELSAYRFVSGEIMEITSADEIAAIEQATQAVGPLVPVARHLQRAVELLADRKRPNYRDSVKESILAVEALCQVLTGGPKATLGDALKVVEEKFKLHGAFKAALSSLYGYSSDAEGIRHALLEEPTLGFEDAKFMLVACSAFVNYVVSKAPKAGISL